MITEEQKLRLQELNELNLGETKRGQLFFIAHPPPETVTGLVIRQSYEAYDHKPLFNWSGRIKTIYYIFQWDCGTYDYNARDGEPMRGATWYSQGYWAFESKEVRDEMLSLIRESIGQRMESNRG